ncbi:hypothetical protein BDK51DRAFT_44029 [Blyttiomyces helicus]|uniref:SH3 domain-containing protein n=1 Tax=Blyttiomyces helicus TaxID=388810 RepID=A0A4P9WGT9_9FUNG|nr:hypothetical protein BDK51DRAFT_44029 [Blyttiomyces helicus]|eukprot:RKO92031.1 hypothetical protein BDK51DRAFT_44029 [Blyttiomyces helicus]
MCAMPGTVLNATACRASALPTCSASLLQQCPGAVSLAAALATPKSTPTPTPTPALTQNAASTSDSPGPAIAGGLSAAIFFAVSVFFIWKYWHPSTADKFELINSLPHQPPPDAGAPQIAEIPPAPPLLNLPSRADSIHRKASPLVTDSADVAIAPIAVSLPLGAEGSGHDPSRKRAQAIREHEPRNKDEMRLKYGDVVMIEKAFQDEWALGWNVVTGVRGVFPLACVDAESTLTESPIIMESPRVGGPRNKVHIPLQRYRVQHRHIPASLDEIALFPGDVVAVEHFFEDLWCLGFDYANSSRGLFPLFCLDELDATTTRSSPTTFRRYPRGTPSPVTIASRENSIHSITDSAMTQSPPPSSPSFTSTEPNPSNRSFVDIALDSIVDARQRAIEDLSRQIVAEPDINWRRVLEQRLEQLENTPV